MIKKKHILTVIGALTIAFATNTYAMMGGGTGGNHGGSSSGNQNQGYHIDNEAMDSGNYSQESHMDDTDTGPIKNDRDYQKNNNKPTIHNPDNHMNNSDAASDGYHQGDVKDNGNM